MPPVALDEPAFFGNGVVARVTSLEAVQGEARGPGEIAGPALRVVVEIRNTSERAVSLARSVVIVSYGREPGARGRAERPGSASTGGVGARRWLGDRQLCLRRPGGRAQQHPGEHQRARP